MFEKIGNFILRRLFKKKRPRKLIARTFRENFPAQRGLYFIAMVAMVVVAATSALTAYLMEAIVDSMTNYAERWRIFAVAGTVALVFTIKGIATYAQIVALSRAGNRIVRTQQEALYKKLMQHGVSFFANMESSMLLQRMSMGADSMRRLLDLIITSGARDLLMLIGLVGVMFYQQPVLSLVSLIVGPLAILGVKRVVKKVRKIMETEVGAMVEIIRVVQETSKGIQIIKVFSLEETMTGRMGTAAREVEKRRNSIARLGAITSPLMETLAGFAIAGIVALSALNVMGSQQPTAGQLMSFITALLMAYEPAKRLSKVRVGMETAMIGVGMMYSIFDYTEDLVEAENAQELKPGPGTVALRGVGFGYRDEEPIFEDLTMTFPAGKMTALVGPSGGGKSTILNLIMRLYDPQEGGVEIDGQDVKDVTFASLRRRISYVGQDTFLFSNSVRENLRCSRPDATEEEIVAAAKAANAHDFIMALPEGYDTEVGENGAFLSGGQKQRLSIARAVLRDSDILLLDEATSALDAQSEALVKEALDRLTETKTSIVIAHRLSTVLEADKIIVIADGRVEEEGTAESLLKDAGRFKSLFDQQYSGYRLATEGEDQVEGV